MIEDPMIHYPFTEDDLAMAVVQIQDMVVQHIEDANAKKFQIGHLVLGAKIDESPWALLTVVTPDAQGGLGYDPETLEQALKDVVWGTKQ